jgi:tRNA A-37 threonylcarbamoyl transferase component Bud32/tetratricopeptide (TPR) repeat protein
MQTIGKYQLEKVLGRGGMGTVYQALDPVLHRRVAVKMMIPGLAEAPDLRARFLREAQAAGGLRHRNIVTVYDLGEDKGQPYIAMEFIEGSDLERVIQQKEPYPVEWKLDVLRQVCEGLGYAHRNGIIHRDIKPANIRVTPEGEVKIMDFGIAHLQSSTMTKSGLVLGTVHYMAPEQVHGRKPDHRADIFAVGSIAYELLSYRRPFEGDSLTAVMFKITHEAPDLAGIGQTEYSPGLEEIVSRALAKDVEQRYQSLEQMRVDLEKLVRETASRLAAKATVVPAAAPPAPAAPAPAGGDPQRAEIRRELQTARAAGHLQMALFQARRLLELDPHDPELTRQVTEIEVAIRDRDIEQLATKALEYAAEGDLELAQKIAMRIGRMAPRSARFQQLETHLAEEAARQTAEALTAAAQEHLALGNLEEAKAAAEEALVARPHHSLAREIRERVTHVLTTRERSRTPPPRQEEQEPIPVKAQPASAEVATLTPLPVPPPEPEPPPPPPVAPPPVVVVQPPAVAPPPVVVAPPPVVEPPPPVVAPEPAPTVIPTTTPSGGTDPARLKRAEAAALATTALNHFLQNDYAKARKAVEKALLLEPENKRARELLNVLSALR